MTLQLRGQAFLGLRRALPPGARVRRCWPSRDGLAVEYRTHAGRLTAATWADGHLETLGTADPGLPGLAQTAARPAGELVSHRAGRRAVVRLAGTFVKVVRPSRSSDLARSLARATALLAQVPELKTAPITQVSTDAGLVGQAALDGPTVHALWTTDPTLAANLMTRLGETLGTIADLAAPEIPAHDATAEADVVRHWADTAARWRVAPPGLSRAADAALTRLATLPAPRLVPTHRDLHDKQLIATGGGLALIDLDTLARADPALDVGNLLAHLQLRVLQGACRPATAVIAARHLARARARAPHPPPPEAVEIYRAAALTRLAAVYAFRPTRRGLCRRLLTSQDALRYQP